MKTVQIVIKGSVQGVFFRVSAKEIADKLNLKGWVKNTEKGDVETVAQGEDESIATFIDWCQQGPSKAAVNRIDVKEIKHEAITGFTVIR